MDRLFTQNRDDFRTTLGVVCRYLSLENLLALEEVSDLCRSAVQSHHWDEEMNFQLPDFLPHKLPQPLVTNRTGPAILNLFIFIEMKSAVSTGDHKFDVQLWRAVNWMVTALNRRAAHLRQLKIIIRARRDQDQEEGELFLQQTQDLPSECNKLALFPKCTQLEIEFNGFAARQPHEKYILSTLLQNFPALERLKLVGSHLPLLSELSAPEKLKFLKLDVNNNDLGTYWYSWRVASKIINFQRLESISLSRRRDFEVQEVEDALNHFTAATGVRLLESFSCIREGNPLRSISLDNLTDWSAALLSSDRVGATQFGILKLEINYLGWPLCLNLIRKLDGLMSAGSLLARVTHLSIGCIRSERGISQFLKLTPSLQELSIKSVTNEGLEPYGEVGWPLNSLTHLQVTDRMGDNWVESVRRNASPTMEVTLI